MGNHKNAENPISEEVGDLEEQTNTSSQQVNSDNILSQSSEANNHPLSAKCCWKLLKPVVFSAEIPMVLYFVAYGIFTPAQQHFIYKRICLYKYDSEDICSQIDTSPALKVEEAAVQADFAVFSTIFNATSFLPVIVVAVILGMWCDRFSHRIPMAFPHIGSIFVGALYLPFAFLPSQAINPIWLGIVSLFSGLGGQISVATMSVASYATRMSSGRSRTVRLAVIEASIALGQTMGFLINAFLFNGGRNYMLAFIVQIAIDVYSIIHIIALVPNLHSASEIKEKVIANARGSWLRYLCSLDEIFMSSFRIFFGKNTKRTLMHRRWLQIMVLNYALCVTSIGARAVTQIIYEFVTLQPISMSPLLYAAFQAALSACIAFGMFVVIRVLRLNCCHPVLPFSDAAIGIFGVFSRILSMIALAAGGFFPILSPWISCVLGLGANFVFVSLRSGMSKLTDEDEHGRIFAVICICENLFGLAASLGFNSLYGALVSQSPSPEQVAYFVHGYSFIFIAGLAVPPLLVFVWLGRQPIKNYSFNSYANKIVQTTRP